jgi:hypothetical protein
MNTTTKGTVRIYNLAGRVLDMLVPGCLEQAINLNNNGKWPDAMKITCIAGIDELVAMKPLHGDNWQVLNSIESIANHNSAVKYGI